VSVKEERRIEVVTGCCIVGLVGRTEVNNKLKNLVIAKSYVGFWLDLGLGLG